MNVLVVGAGSIDLDAIVGGTPNRIRRYARTDDRAALSDVVFDLAVLIGFPDDLPPPDMLLRDVATLLGADARLVIVTASVVRPSIRATVFGGSFGEAVGPIVTDADVAMHGHAAMTTLLATAGFALVEPARTGAYLQATLLSREPAATAEPVVPVPANESSDAERLRDALREVRELREFFERVHEGRRALHKETVRLRALLDARDREIGELRDDVARAREKISGEANLRARLDRSSEEMSLARATISDLEARHERMRASLVADDVDYASTE